MIALNLITLNLPITEFFILQSNNGECLYCNQYSRVSNNFSADMVSKIYYSMKLFANSLSDSFEELVFKGTMVYMIKGEIIDCFIKVNREQASEAKELIPFFRRIVNLFEKLYSIHISELNYFNFGNFEHEIKKMIMRDLSYLFINEEGNSKNNIINSKIDNDIFLSSKIVFSLLSNLKRAELNNNGTHIGLSSVDKVLNNKIPNSKSRNGSKIDKDLKNNNYFGNLQQYSL